MTPKIVSRSAEHGTKEILIVDDDFVNRKVLRHMVEKLGHPVSVVTSGSEAVAAVQGQDFAAVLLDCQMPVMDGYETARKLRESEGPGAEIPIIAVTAQDLSRVREKALASGIDDCLSKPVNLESLKKVLSFWTDKRKVGDSEETDSESREGELDWNVIETILSLDEGKEPKTLAEVIRLYLVDAPVRLERIARGIGTNNLREVEASAHALKGASATLGAVCMAQLSRDMIVACNSRVPSDLERLYRHLTYEYEAISSALNGLLARLEG